jgi:hypothetical protein
VLSTYLGPPYDPDAEPLGVAPPATPLDARPVLVEDPSALVPSSRAEQTSHPLSGRVRSAAIARAFVARHHYSASASSTAHRYGLHCRGDLVGVALFGPPASMAAHRAVFPSLTIREAVTLGRLVLLDSVPGNGESWSLARCFELLRAAGIVAVESCADPEPRTTVSGDVVLRGHVGTIYHMPPAAYGRLN